MKRFGCMFLMFILSVFYAGIALAVEVTVFEEQYARTTGEANSYADTFFGFPGNGKLIIINGYEDGKNRISDAEIEINGSVVAGSGDFNQKVYRIEVPVDLGEDNSISVKLESIPGSFLTVQVVQEATETEASAIIGPEGGVVEVIDPNSSIYGVSVNIPEGALSEEALISIKTKKRQHPLPDSMTSIGDVIELGPDGIEFNFPILVSLPVNYEVDFNQNKTIGVVYYNHNTEEWELIPPFGYDSETDRFMFFVHHFSDYQLVSMNTDDADVKVPFNILKDSLSALNNVDTLRSIDCYDETSRLNGICSGMVAFSKWYYDNKRSEEEGHFLRCTFDIDSAAKISCGVHNELKETINNLLHSVETLKPNFGGNIFSTIKNYIIDKLEEDKTPVLLGMMGQINGSLGGHSVLVVGWTNTTEGSGYFTVYDPNDNKRLHLIDYNKTIFGGTFSYSDHTFNNETTNLNEFTPTVGTLKHIDFDSYYNNETDYPKSTDGCYNNNGSTGKIPDTGQTICSSEGNFITCPSPGQPFYGQDANYNINPKSYTKLGYNGVELPDDAQHVDEGGPWIMTKDNVTGLIWEVKDKDYFDGGIHNRGNDYTWYDAQEVFINQLNNDNFGGYSDWRLPTVTELSMLREEHGYFILSFNRNFFTVTESNDGNSYWSSTSIAVLNLYNAWSVYVYGPALSMSEGRDKRYTLAVRGKKASPNLLDNGNGTAVDLSSGLMWQQAEAGSMTWKDALECCENLEIAGYDDWRLPNKNELISIVDYSQYDPSANSIIFNGVSSSWYWTSTAWYGRAVVVDFKYGQIGVDDHLYDHNVRCVRGGQ